MLDWTGERYLPWIQSGHIHYEHLHRYAFAAQFVRGKNVLDLACGEGYGSYILAKQAKSVVSLEIDDRTVKHASNKYLRSNLQFIKGSMLEIPIPGEEEFDAIICFEGIEHVADHDKLLSEVKRLLKRDGIFIVSTPNKIAYTVEADYHNPFHVKELNFDEFKELLSRYFKNAHYLGQRVYAGSNLWNLNAEEYSDYHEFVIEKGGDEYYFTESSHKSPLYFIAVASDSDVRSIVANTASWLLDASDVLLRHLQGQVTQLAYGIQLKDGLISELTNALQARDAQILQMQQGIIMQLLARYQRVVEKLLRPGSRRRHYYELWLAGLRIILNKGWQSSERDRHRQNRRIEFASKYIRGIGIEIGPLHQHLEVPPNVVVRYVGRLSWRIIGVLSRITKGYKVISPGIMDNATNLEKMNDESYDFVICSHLLEHISNPIEAITNWLRVLKPGGILYIAVPDASNPLDTGQEITTTEHLVQDHQADIPSYVQSIGLDILDMRVIDSAGNKINGVNVKEHIYIVEKTSYIPKIIDILQKIPQRMDTETTYLVDVVVPIYNAYEDFEKCLYSLFKYQDIYRIVLIDDGSTDRRVKELLHTLKEHECEPFRIIENEENVGFVRTVNKGMKMSENDVILLNTDTIVTNGWAEKMRACAESHSSIATVNPFSNNCVVCTIPGGIPEGFSIDSFAECVETASFKKYPELPATFGFCMYIKRDVINKLGYFDEESFGKGYGEETDFCLRAIQKGYRNVLCDNTFVFHKGQASFLDAHVSLVQDSRIVISQRYPDYFRTFDEFCRLNPLKELHDNIKLRMATWNISGRKGVTGHRRPARQGHLKTSHLS